ncbi:hypothetical protein NG831_07470 [Xanthomonas sacchari]|nr:hypothetical protein NG831_07470 [Xanthomonas sacchari]
MPPACPPMRCAAIRSSHPPGRPSLYLVQLRQQQAAAQQAVRRANQTLAQAAAGFVRSAGLTPPPRTGPVAFVQGWLARHLG